MYSTTVIETGNACWRVKNRACRSPTSGARSPPIDRLLAAVRSGLSCVFQVRLFVEGSHGRVER